MTNSVTINRPGRSFKVKVGDPVIVMCEGECTVGFVDQLDLGHKYGEIGMSTGGWFMRNGDMNIGSGWYIDRLANQHEVNTLPSY